ncbi:MAG: hypothetical protein WC152_08565 [Candidatus Izemoplasmatales bacterium]
MIRITEIKLTLDQAINKDIEIRNIKKYLNNKYKIKKIKELSIFKKAVDARKKTNIVFVYTVDITTEDDNLLIRLKDKHISISPSLEYINVTSGEERLNSRPVIIGFGPSGIFSALLLARNNYKPLVIEMGLDVDNRDVLFEQFIKTREFNKLASIQFGEGGAGTYSDGKLTTSISDLRCRYVLDTFVKHGADSELLYINKPHVGTDVLKNIIKELRNEIVSLGGEIIFNSQMTDIIIKNNKVSAIEINNKDIVHTNVLLLGIGHSSRDTFELLLNRKFSITRKPFSFGVRIEHPQSLINKSQYGAFANHPSLKAADYKLSFHDSNGRSAYTFCMCPGGYVMCGSSEPGGVVTNGMSESNRNGENSNSAVLVNIQTDDFNDNNVLSGMKFQRELEQLAFKVAGSNYNAPAQLVGDFINNKTSKVLGSVTPTYKPDVTLVDFNKIIPGFILPTLKRALIDFDKKINGFAMDDAVITGFETRSSSPIRIVRNDNFEANIEGVFPMGEGAGYAGGIMSSAVDGIKIAEEVIRRYKSLE